MSVNPTWRIRLLSLLILALFGLLIARLFFLQVIKNDYYLNKADRQNQPPLGQLLDRGAIFFRQRDGDLVSAATMRDGFLLAINPKVLKKAEAVFQKLASLVPLDADRFFKQAAKTADPYEEVANHLDGPTAATIKDWNLPGVSVYKTRWRFYPAGRSAAHLLGLLNRDGVGTYGLEKYYTGFLQRQADESFISFLSGVLSDFEGSVSGDNRRSEGDLVLNIEPVVQNTLETELAGIFAKWQPEETGGIVMDPSTGQVIALAALPNFDPGGRQDNLAILANPLIERVYEMGSIMKPLTMAAALDAGVVKPTTTYHDGGTVTFNGQTVSNFDQRGRGVVSMQEVLNQSLNTGAVFAMQKLGRTKFRGYLLNYGLAEKTDIDLPNEIGGLTKNLNSPRDIEYATAAFGQGIAVTPLAMTRALAALANGGKLVKPKVVGEFIYHNSRLTQTVKPEIVRQVLKPETSRTITSMLVTAFDTGLLGGKYKLQKYQVAAKTGTAQQAQPDGHYDFARFLHSFFGYFPASNPRFIVFLYQRYPVGARYASDTLTEPFVALTKFLLNYYNVPPDR